MTIFNVRGAFARLTGIPYGIGSSYTPAIASTVETTIHSVKRPEPIGGADTAFLGFESVDFSTAIPKIPTILVHGNPLQFALDHSTQNQFASVFWPDAKPDRNFRTSMGKGYWRRRSSAAVGVNDYHREQCVKRKSDKAIFLLYYNLITADSQCFF